MIKEIRKVHTQLKGTSSKLMKLDILMRNKDVPGLKEFFKLCLCPSLNYYHTKLPAVEFTDDSGLIDLPSMLLIAGAATKPTDAKNILEGIAESGTPDDVWFTTRVLKRKPDCGVDTVVNKVWPGLVRTQLYQGAIADDVEKTQKMYTKGRVLLEKKYDGCHMITVFGAGNTSLRSRQGEDFPFLPELERHVALLKTAIEYGNKDLINGCYMAGEGLIRDPLQQTGYATRAIGNSLIQEGKYDGFEMRVWDLLPIADVEDHIICHTLQARRMVLKLAIQKYHVVCRSQGIAPVFKLSIGYYCNSYTQAHAKVEQWISQGEEGGLHKDPMQKFTNGKPSTIIKDTFSMDVDALIISTAPHRQKHSQIGSYLCEIPAGAANGKIRFKAGSGLTEDMRTQHPDDVVGRVVTCTIKDVSCAKTKKAVMSVNSPRVADTRNAFKEADCSDDVFERYEARTNRRHPLDKRS